MLYGPSTCVWVSFSSSRIRENRCVRLLVKNREKKMPKYVVREDLETITFRVQGFMQLRSSRSDYDPRSSAFLRGNL